jgi:energy-coupling factor transporter ATP-binding protein EcfA2
VKITRLSVRRFRGFHADFSLELLQGQNVLLYGDNGSGKSSIASALKHLLTDKPKPISPHRNIFSAQGEDAEVEVTYQPWPDPRAATIRWDGTGHPMDPALNRLNGPTRQAFRNAVARSAFIDYRDLLRTSGSEYSLPVEFFELVAGTLLRTVETNVNGRSTTLGELYDKVRAIPEGLRKQDRIAAANVHAQNFNGAFQGLLAPLEAKVTELLAHFDSLHTTIHFDYTPIRWPLASRGRLKPVASFKLAQLNHSPAVLNEARLTALAVCIFLAGVLISDVDPANPGHPRLLVLDDALISMDANNRKPVLDILQTPAFQHFQIILLTHDSVWFDIARKQLSGWKVCKLVTEHPERADEPSVPLFTDLGRGGPASDLDIAEIHLNRDDKPAAAVYARSAFERKLKKIAEDNPRGIKVPFKAEVKQMDANTLWQTIQQWNQSLTNPLIPAAMENNIEMFRSNVLNELSHSEPRIWDRPTILAAFATLRQFCMLRNTPVPVRPPETLEGGLGI